MNEQHQRSNLYEWVSEKVFLYLSMQNDEDSVSDQKRIQSALRDRDPSTSHFRFTCCVHCIPCAAMLISGSLLLRYTRKQAGSGAGNRV